MNLADLSKPFPQDAVSWRAQTLSKNKDKALALAYIDARDVMNRLDQVCGPEGWQDEYTETPTKRVLCRIGIRVGEEWVWKSDGAGATDVEGEKGGISDAFKRAAVKWGVGRYLYDIKSPWVPCQLGYNGKWKEWAADPWLYVKGQQNPAPQRSTRNEAPNETPPQDNQGEPPFCPEAARDRIRIAISKMKTEQQVDSLWKIEKECLGAIKSSNLAVYNEIVADFQDAKRKAHADPALQAPAGDHIPGAFGDAA